MVKTLPRIAAIHSRCSLWLCGQCHGGSDCTCLPQFDNADTDQGQASADIPAEAEDQPSALLPQQTDCAEGMP